MDIEKQLKEISQIMAKKMEEEMCKALLQDCEISGSTMATNINRGLTKEDIEKVINEIVKHKINVKPNPYIGKDEAIIIDNEKLRKEFPYLQERGKTIMYNPENKELGEYLNNIENIYQNPEILKEK